MDMTLQEYNEFVLHLANQNLDTKEGAIGIWGNSQPPIFYYYRENDAKVNL